MTIAIFGGSFNPPHAAHELAALYVLETCEDVHELWFVPTFVHPFSKPLAPYDDRVAMCQLLADSLGDRVVVSRAEQALAKTPGFVASRTLDLIEMLSHARPHDRFRLVIGTDILTETDKWYRWDDLVALAPPIVVGSRRISRGRRRLEMPSISATRVRELLAKRDPAVSALVPHQVLRYIAAHQLYTS